MGPQERRLLSELAVYLVRSCSRALQELPPGATLDIAERRRWFARAYREWQLTPRVDLAGRAPYEVIAAERAAETAQPPKAAIELYTDLASFDPGLPFPANQHATSGLRDDTTAEPSAEAEPAPGGKRAGAVEWQYLANRLFGSWLDEELDRL